MVKSINQFLLICFVFSLYLIPEYHQLLVYPIWLVNFDSYVNHINHLASLTQRRRNIIASVRNPPTRTFWHFNFVILIRETVFLKVGRLCGIREMLKGSPLLSSRYFSLARFFTARPHFSIVSTDREAGRGYNAFYVEVLYNRWLRLKVYSQKFKTFRF